MTLREILSADMPTLRGWIAQGWDWWTDQLLSMLPAKLRRGHRGVILHRDPRDPSGWRTGSDQSALMLSRRQQRNVLLALDPGEVLCRIIDVPPLGRGDLRQMLAHDIDRIGPMPKADACFDFEVLERSEERQSIRIAMLPRQRLTGWLDELAALGIAPARVALREEDGAHFDFLRAAGLSSRASTGLGWWIALALLFALNLGALVWRDIALTQATQDAVEAQAPAGRSALMIRQRIEKEQQQRQWIVRTRAQNDPLPAMAAITAALPPSAWVQRLEYRQGQLRLVGFAPGATDVAEALRQSPMLRAVNENDAEAAPAGEANQMRAFDISATLAPGAAQ